MNLEGAAALLLGLSLLGCASLDPRPRMLPECPGSLVSTRELRGEFLLRQRARIAYDGLEIPLRVAMQLKEDELVVLGFDPFGAKLFAIVQVDERTQIESAPPPVLVVPPINVLRDLHRIHFLGTGPPPGGEGEAVGVRDGTRISERWEGGSLRARTFERIEAEPAGRVRVDFATGAGGEAIRIENEWCGYGATFVTLSEEELR